jgi:hypothetical protein
MFIHYIQNCRFHKGYATAQTVRRRRQKRRWDRMLQEYLDFPLFVSLPHQCSALIFILVLVLSQGQEDKAWEPSNKGMLFVFQISVRQKCTFALLSPFTEDTMPMVMAAYAVKCIVLYSPAANFLAELREHSYIQSNCQASCSLLCVAAARLTSERARGALPLSKKLFCEYSQLQSLWTFLERTE